MWREKCLEEGISERRYIKVPRGGIKGKKGTGVGIGSSWKAAFLRQVRIETNWRTGSKKQAKVTGSSKHQLPQDLYVTKAFAS